MSTHKKHAEKRGTILAAATRVAREGGLRSTNVRAIATEAGTSPASVLYYFKSVDGLMDLALDHIFTEYYVDRRQQIESITDPVMQVRELIRLGVSDTVSEDMRLVYDVAANLPRYPQFAERLRALHERQVDLYTEVIERGAALGAFTPNPDAATVARNIVAIEDTYDFYPLIGIAVPREGLRENLRSFARTALGAPI